MNIHSRSARVSGRTAFMPTGDDGARHLVQYGLIQQIFTTPHDERTEAYVTGRFG